MNEWNEKTPENLRELTKFNPLQVSTPIKLYQQI